MWQVCDSMRWSTLVAGVFIFGGDAGRSVLGSGEWAESREAKVTPR